MKRNSLLKSKTYWIKKIQIELYNEILDFMSANNLSQNDLAQKLGVTKGYVSQLLNGKFNHKLEKLVELTLMMNKVPIINYPQLKNYIAQEDKGIMFPYKHFEYYIKQNPSERSVSPRFKIDLSKLDTTMPIAQNTRINFEPNQYEEQY